MRDGKDAKDARDQRDTKDQKDTKGRKAARIPLGGFACLGVFARTHDFASSTSLTARSPDGTLRTVAAEKESEQHNSARKFQGPGGTPGGVGMFIFGLALAIAGGYLIMNQVQVTSGYWHWWGTNTFGLTLIPLVIGLGLLVFDGRSMAGWVLSGGGAVIIFVGILENLQIFFTPTTLFNVILMLTMFAAGLGLMARAVKSF